MLIYLVESDQVVASHDLMNLCTISDRTVRNEIKTLNTIGRNHGFEVERVRNVGYRLVIKEQHQFLAYYSSLYVSAEHYTIQQRINDSLLLLFQANGYITIGSLAENSQVSPSTIQTDLKKIDTFLIQQGLSLERRAHYGLRLVGDEAVRRKALQQVFNQSEIQLLKTSDYQNFMETLDMTNLADYLWKRIGFYKIYLSDQAFQNIIEHLRMLLFRVSQHNYIRSMELNQDLANASTFQPCQQLSQDISAYLKQEFQVELPETEIAYLTEHLVGKVTLDSINQVEKDKLYQQIVSALIEVDQAFMTTFSKDEELIQALLMHVYPLLMRLHYNMQLDNPIIEDIYTRYANVFNSALFFIQLIGKEYSLTVSKDEIGYVAIYLAASLEKEKNRILSQYDKIAVVCSSGGGAAFLLKIKLESLFSTGMIETFSINEIAKIKQGNFDVVISTLPLVDPLFRVPVIEVSNLLNEKELNKIRDTLFLAGELQQRQSKTAIHTILDYFKEDCFQRLDYHGDYLTLLEEGANELVELGYGEPHYPAKVMEREKRMNTIYQNGVAGPHGIEMGAKIECISVILLEQPIFYLQKKVQLIFLINLNKGHLWVHKEISLLLMKMMEDDELLARVLRSQNYQEFKQVIQTIR